MNSFLIDGAHLYRIRKFLTILRDNTQNSPGRHCLISISKPWTIFSLVCPLGELLGIRVCHWNHCIYKHMTLTAVQASGSPHQNWWLQSHVMFARSSCQLNGWLRHCCFSPCFSSKFKFHRRTFDRWNLNYIWNSSCKGHGSQPSRVCSKGEAPKIAWSRWARQYTISTTATIHLTRTFWNSTLWDAED